MSRELGGASATRPPLRSRSAFRMKLLVEIAGNPDAADVLHIRLVGPNAARLRICAVASSLSAGVRRTRCRARKHRVWRRIRRP